MDHTAIDAALKGIKHRYITVHGASVVDTVNDMASGGRIQLVAMIHRKRGFLDGLFHSSTAKRMALHTKLPLLVLRQG
ncbi:MAG: universal stress protein [Flavobacteriales bacterium]|nr:universal stress protein [Flavobacteriales bacterium]